jgi:uncharacterized protein YkuJ
VGWAAVSIATESRVYHLSDRNRAEKRKGTVQRVYDRNGTEVAEVLYDHTSQMMTSPVANLVELT